MKKFLYIAGVAFVVTLAVVVGIVCGVLASIPTSAILVWTLRVRDKQIEAQLGQGRGYGQYPPVVVVNGQGTSGLNGPPPALTVGNGGPRTFKVIGQEKTESTGDSLPPIWSEF